MNSLSFVFTVSSVYRSDGRSYDEIYQCYVSGLDVTGNYVVSGRPQGPGRRHRCHGARLVGALGLAELNFIYETISELFIVIGIDFLHVVY